MELQYFKSAWGDIKNSPKWFGKICTLAILNCIPIFGQVATFGYLYGWAREIAWGVHEPMPAKIFSNEDGKFWRRGWFAFVLAFVFMLIPYIVMSLGSYWQGFGYSYSFFSGSTVSNPALVGFGGLLSLVGGIAFVVMGVFAWIGIMRVSIYDRLSSGFQFGKIWKMFRHDTRGILKIFGMNLIVSLILGFFWFVIFIILATIVVMAGIAGLVSAGYMVAPGAVEYMTETQSVQMFMQFLVSAGLIGIFAFFIGLFMLLFFAMFVEMLVARAMGYWTMQFDVPQWGGQDDPMPFELFKESQLHQQSAGVAQAQSHSDGIQPPAYSQQVTNSVSVDAPIAPVKPPVPAKTTSSTTSETLDSPVVTYEKPATVGASFFLGTEGLDDLGNKGEVTQAADASELNSQSVQSIQNIQAGSSNIGENNEPHVGESNGGESQN